MNLEHDTSRTTLCGPSVTFTLVNMLSSHTLPESTNPISKTGWTKDPKAELEEWCHGGTALREPRASRAMQWTPFPGTFEYDNKAVWQHGIMKHHETIIDHNYLTNASDWSNQMWRNLDGFKPICSPRRPLVALLIGPPWCTYVKAYSIKWNKC